MQRDDHKPSRLTVSCPRPLLLKCMQKTTCVQCDVRSRSFMHKNPSRDPTSGRMSPVEVQAHPTRTHLQINLTLSRHDPSQRRL